MAASMKARVLPSTRWSSFDGWDYNGMKERLQCALDSINTSALVVHAERIKQQDLNLSKPFSAGQYWICFEMVAGDDSLVIARVRLPRYPDTPSTVTEEEETYGIRCEIATMQYVRQRLSGVSVPAVYAYEPPGSSLAADADAAYMLLQGFYGNTLQNVAFNICILPAAVQEQIITQWTSVQAEIATLVHPRIGSISSLSPNGEPIIDKLATASLKGFTDPGPFKTAAEYFKAAGQAAINRYCTGDSGSSTSSHRIGISIFCDIVSRTSLFKDSATESLFPLNHMDLGTQNILIDDSFNFLAIIDCEFAQTAPWQVNHYPMPFPLAQSNDSIQSILKDPSHCAYKNVLQQDFSRSLYRREFQSVEEDLKKDGHALTASFVNILDSPTSRVYACFTKLGQVPEGDEDLVHEMVRLAFGWIAGEAEAYVRQIRVSLSSAAEH